MQRNPNLRSSLRGRSRGNPRRRLLVEIAASRTRSSQ